MTTRQREGQRIKVVKRLGGRWDAERGAWLLSKAKTSEIKKLRAYVARWNRKARRR